MDGIVLVLIHIASTSRHDYFVFFSSDENEEAILRAAHSLLKKESRKLDDANVLRQQATEKRRVLRRFAHLACENRAFFLELVRPENREAPLVCIVTRSVDNAIDRYLHEKPRPSLGDWVMR